MNFGPGELILFALIFGVVTGVVGYSGRGATRSFVQFFVLGALVPVVGLMPAIIVKRSSAHDRRVVATS